jgi:GNAT superfamily N-acetyltransferase
MITPHSFFVESAELKDVPAIAEFQLCHASEVENLRLDSMRVQEGVARVIEDHTLGFYLVARDRSPNGGTHTIGTLLITKEWSDWRAKFVWWIQSVFVLPDFRRKGVFTALYRHVESEAHAQDAAGIRLYVDRNNHSAKAVYQRLGLNSEHYEMFEKLF